MTKSIIKVGYQDGDFLVTATIDENYSIDKDWVGVLKGFDNSVDAIKYAMAVMDGIQIYTKTGYFEPTSIEDVALTPEAVAELTGFILPFRKRKTILCHVDTCIHNNKQGGCRNKNDNVSIALYDKQAQCCAYEADNH